MCRVDPPTALSGVLSVLLDQIMNIAATIRHMSGGQFHVPVVIRMATGGGRRFAAQHPHSLEGWYAHIPWPVRVSNAASLAAETCRFITIQLIMLGSARWRS